MAIAEKIVDYLRSREITEAELIRVYKNFGEKVYKEGFNEGCEFIRGVYSKQRASRRQCLRNYYKRFLTKLDDHLHAIQ